MRTIEYKGKLPDPFMKADGTRMTPDEWWEKRGEIKDFVIDMAFGGMPPKPEMLEYELLTENYVLCGPEGEWYKVTAGTKEKQVTFMLNLIVPVEREPDGTLKKDKKYPVLLTGDGCYTGLESDTVREALRRGYITARFNRLEIANDVKGRRSGGIYDVYPENTDFTAISAWAWGYSVVMDVLEKLPYADETEVGITGHSRGGKTVQLAAVYDERIKYVCPNNSGCHGANSYRVVVTGQGDTERRSERISDMFKNIPHWMGKKLEPFADREDEIPYDMHWFGALVAPRYFVQFEGMQDYWINPVGARCNALAVRECYRYLGYDGRCGAWFRPGGHRHKLPDFTEFMDFMDRARAGLPIREHLLTDPYPDVCRNFDF